MPWRSMARVVSVCPYNLAHYAGWMRKNGSQNVYYC